MIALKTVNIVTTTSTEELISRLSWKLHPSKGLILKTNSIEHDTIKPLLGKLDNNVFRVARIRSIYKMLLPVVIIHGRLMQNGDMTTLKLQYKPGILSTLVLLWFIYAAIELIRSQMNIGFDLESVLGLSIWTLIFPVGGIVLTLREGDKTKDMLLNIFGIKE